MYEMTVFPPQGNMTPGVVEVVQGELRPQTATLLRAYHALVWATSALAAPVHSTAM